MKLRPVSDMICIFLLFSTVGFDTAFAAPSNQDVSQAVNWLTAQEKPDGGFPGFSGSSDPGTSTDVALAVASSGVDPSTISDNGVSLIAYLASQAASYDTTVAGAAKLLLAAVASGQPPREFAGQNLVNIVLSHLNPSTGLFDSQLYVHAYAMLALSSAGQTVPRSAVNALVQHQSSNGGWAFSGSTDPTQTDSNTTAIAIQALVASGHGASPAISSAMSYLSTLKTSDGLFAYQPTPGKPLVGDANSTALVIQAMLATGKSMDSTNVASAVTALETLRDNATGAFIYRGDTPGDNLLATVQAIPALAGKTLPIWPVHAPGRTLDQAKTAAAPGNSQLCIYFPQTGHNACQGFLAYWKDYGGLQAFGYPLTEEFTYVDPTTGRPTTMQYFQRARFEWHPGSDPQRYDVQLGLLGAEMLNGQ